MTPPSPSIPRSLTVPYEASRRICRHHARSFYFASHFLPKAKRLHAYAVYAFCRGIDDAVDDATPETVDERLAAFKQVLASVYSGPLRKAGLSPDQAQAIEAFAHTVHTCSIPQSYFLDLATGCTMDLTITRYPDWPALESYCYHVAGVVGLIMCRVFGLQNESALAQAVQMGNAMQLTNILRDIKEDHSRGRIYLPQNELQQFGVTETDISQGKMTEGMSALMTFQVSRARSLYTIASQGLAHLPNDGSRFTASAMATIYAGILTALESQNLNPFEQRARTTMGQKLTRLLKARRLSQGRPITF